MPQDTGLTAYWISFPDNPHFPLGFGVTAWSVDDAISILDEFGYDHHRRTSNVNVDSDVTCDDLDRDHVLSNIGPIIVRGIWYPFRQVGV